MALPTDGHPELQSVGTFKYEPANDPDGDINIYGSQLQANDEALRAALNQTKDNLQTSIKDNKAVSDDALAKEKAARVSSDSAISTKLHEKLNVNGNPSDQNIYITYSNENKTPTVTLSIGD